MILKILASFFTGIGGHYINRRWDKAILFFCLFVFSWILAYVALIFFLQFFSGTVNGLGEKYISLAKITSGTSTAVIFILWLISFTITVLDSKKKVEPTIVKWTTSGVIGAIFTSLLTFILLAYTVGAFVTVNVRKNVDDELNSYSTDRSGFLDNNFYERLYFGGEPTNSFSLPSPPEGNGVLKGKIVYQNNPAVGVKLSIILNSKYNAKDIITDSEGLFTLNLQPGSWTINSIQAENWENKPETGRFSLYYGGEEKFTGGTYYPHRRRFRDSGYSVKVTSKPAKPHFNITIRDDIDLLWPNPNIKRIDATMDDTIEWAQPSDATQYYVEIKKVTRKDTTTYYEKIATKALSGGTTIPLSSLKHRNTGESESSEYAVEIYAFSEDGTLVSEFTDTYQGGTFLLSDGDVLIKEEIDELFDLSSMSNDEIEGTLEAIDLNRKRGNAVSTLIDDNMLGEAEVLLNLMDSEYSKGKKEALSGYIYAIKGDCKKAGEMFVKAETINPNVCIPESYKINCE